MTVLLLCLLESCQITCQWTVALFTVFCFTITWKVEEVFCITVGKSKDFTSLCNFERHGGKATTCNWKKSIQYKKQPIGDFLQDCISPTSSKHCCCFVVCGWLSSGVSPLVDCLVFLSSSMGAFSTDLTPASSSVCLSIPQLLLVFVVILLPFYINSDSLPVAPFSMCAPSASPSPIGSPGGMSCVLCSKAAKTVAALRQHINSFHISRGCILPLTFFQCFDCFICSNSFFLSICLFH